MNYIEQINMFWILDAEHSFNGNESRLYFYLLYKSNSLYWKNPLTNADGYTAEVVGIAVNTLKSVRNRLQQAGLITFKPGGNGSRNKCTYYIVPASEVLKSFNKVSNFDTLSYKTLTPYLIPGIEFPDDINKHKLKQNNIDGANQDLPSVPGKKIERKEVRKKKIEAFVPPTIETAEQFFLEKTKTFWPIELAKAEAQDFIDHYEANGWVQNKGKPIIKWEAAANKWINRAKTGEFRSHKGVAVTEKQETKPDELLKTEIDSFYASFLKGQNGIAKIKPEHYELLKRLSLTKLHPDIIGQIKSASIAQRIDMLIGSNKASDLRLLEAYQKMEPQDVLLTDKDNLNCLSRRLAIVELFKIRKANGKQKFFE